uniref:Uncharacterized protein n=1 Tax=Ananas comosus var. bracteatus TaxID=296719 RepID=A0A6V7Q9X2_ANACO|nr:unnamed protein product [Ananas comosus var. bracteatus]
MQDTHPSCHARNPANRIRSGTCTRPAKWARFFYQHEVDTYTNLYDGIHDMDTVSIRYFHLNRVFLHSQGSTQGSPACAAPNGPVVVYTPHGNPLRHPIPHGRATVA